jgi:predicted RNase H-like HicB family nuclease
MKYTVTYEKDRTGWWIASVKQLRGCHTQGRTIEQARKRIKEALGLFVNNADKAILIENIKLPQNVNQILAKLSATRKKAEQESERLSDLTAEAACMLTEDLNMSVRDAGAVLGLSHQRVHQLVASHDK